jgi:DNA-binding transcriptional LysR family regulator
MNITKAASNLHISQPSLTVAIKNLEEELGVNLFYRSKQRISLTIEGEFFLNRLQPIIDSLNDLFIEMVSVGEKSNALKIGIPPMMGSFLFPQIFSKFILTNTDLDVEIIEHGALRVHELLLEEELDLTLMILESQSSKDIYFDTIEERNFVLYVNPNHRLAGKKSVSFKDLEGESLIMFNKEFYVSKVVNEGFERNGIKANIILETTQINTMKRFIKDGLASSILIEGTLSEDDASVCIPITGIEPITIGMARKKNHFVTGSMKRMLTFIKGKQWMDK